nr:RNA-directed DNA polymerase, eukaryota [Tanacetum cinerariifolium]
MHHKRSMEVNGSSPVGVHGPSISSASVLVLDDSCVAERDMSNHVMGIPLNVWSRETFTRIGKKWGEALDIEDNVDSSFGRKPKGISVVVNAKVMNNSQDVYKEASCDNVDPNVVKKGGSVLGVIKDILRVGKAIGYSMDGCVKDLKQIIGTQGVGDVPR